MFKNAGFPSLREFVSPGICGVDGDAIEDDEDVGGAPPVTFTQEQVNKLLAQERRRSEKKLADLEGLKAQVEESKGLATRLQELEEQAELAGKSAEEKAKAVAERAQAQSAKRVADLEAQIKALSTERDTAAGKLTDHVKRSAASDALSKAGVLQGAEKHALRAFLEDVRFDLDEEGRITGAEYQDVPQDIAAAAAAFLSDNDLFKAAKPGGSGTRTPTSGALTDKDIDSMSSSELAAHGWNQKPSTRSGTDRVERELDGNQ